MQKIQWMTGKQTLAKPHFFVVALFAATACVVLSSACVTTKKHPCADGGQPPRESGVVGKGTKQCIQQKDPSGRFVNHGKYVEWHPNGKRAIDGEYTSGTKIGKWTEWDENGKVISEKWYENGVAVPDRNTPTDAPGTAVTPVPAAGITPQTNNPKGPTR